MRSYAIITLFLWRSIASIAEPAQVSYINVTAPIGSPTRCFCNSDAISCLGQDYCELRHGEDKCVVMETTEESSLKVYSMHCMVWLRAKVACAQEAYGDMKVHCCAENFCNSPKYFNTGASNETHQNHNSKGVVIAAASVCAVGVTLLLAALACIIYRKKLARRLSPSVDLERFESGMSSLSGSGATRLIERTVSRSITLDKVIGYGRFGSVYRAKYLGSDVAVKIFTSIDENSWRKELEIYDMNIRHRFVLELIAADLASHRAVTQFWLITTLHEKGSLHSYLNERRQISLQECLLLLASAAEGLNYLHTPLVGTSHLPTLGSSSRKPAIAHRDVKTKNILVKNDGTCCIADLGLALAQTTWQLGEPIKHQATGLDQALSRNSESTVGISLCCGASDDKINSATDVKIRVGTKRYMSPEVVSDSLNKNSFDAYCAADIYSFSLTMWETLTNSSIRDDYLLPYYNLVPTDPTIEEMRKVVVNDEYRPVIQLDICSPDESDRLTAIITESWCENPARRLSMLNIKKKLDSLYQGVLAKADASSRTALTPDSLHLR